MNKKIIFATIAALAAIVLSSCGITDTDLADPSFTTLRYDGGFAQGSKFKECVPAGSKLNTDDKFYRYPNTQREMVYDSDHYTDSNGDGISEGSADYPDLKVNVNGVDMFTKMRVQFVLNTDCSPKTINGKKYPGGTIQAFHELIGKTRGMAFDSEGHYHAGWVFGLDNYLSPAAVSLATPAIRKYQPEDAWNDRVVKNVAAVSAWQNISNTVAAGANKKINDAMDTKEQFYKVTAVNVFGMNPDDNFKRQFAERASAKNRAETANLNRQSRITEANADAAVAAARAREKAAEIRGYGSFENYARAQCVASEFCGNPFQPTYKVSGTN